MSDASNSAFAQRFNGQANCILEVCCLVQNAQQSFSAELAKDTGMDAEYCDKAAAWVYQHFDLAERGTLAALKASIARVAKA